MKKKIDATDVANSLKQLIPTGEAFEIRAFSSTENKPPSVGFFTDPAIAAESMAELEDHQFYFTINSIDGSFNDRMNTGIAPSSATKDSNIIRRRILAIDVDPTRPAGQCATDAEKAEAKSVLDEVVRYLSNTGWSEPVTVDSGNGYYALYRVDVPVAAEVPNQFKRVLEVLAERFDRPTAHVDTSIHNKSRILRVPCTYNLKGANTEERPHRLSRITSFPDSWDVVPASAIQGLIPNELPQNTNHNHINAASNNPDWIFKWVEDHKKELPPSTGWVSWERGRKLVFDVCPFDSSHTNKSAFITVDEVGRISAGCHHNSCQQNDWHKLRELVEGKKPFNPSGGLAALADFNNRFSVVGGGDCFVIEETINERGEDDLVCWGMQAFHQYHSNKFISFPLDDKTVEYPLTKKWMKWKDRRTYDKLVFDPSGRADPSRFFNLWKGFAVKPFMGDWSKMKAHIKEIICNNDEGHYKYLTSFMAHVVQNPTDKIGVSVVMRGGQGTGKGMFMSALKKIYGKHFLHLTDHQSLTGKFNNILKDAMIVFSDEAFFHGDKSALGRLKALITEKTTKLERKGVDPTIVDNYSVIFMASNEEFIVPAGLDERRFFVLEVSPARKQDTKYFAELKAELDNGGAEAMLYDLMHLDISGIDLRCVPQTEALIDQKIRNLGSVEAWWHQCLTMGEFNDNRVEATTTFTGGKSITKRELHDWYLEFCKSRSRFSYPEGNDLFCKKLLSLCPSLKSSRTTVGDKRVTCFVLPTLETAQKEFNQRIKADLKYETTEAASEAEVTVEADDDILSFFGRAA